jgi:CPA2 family monovalent cation:H+ antiporter-2
VISIIFICLGTAFLTYELGLSLALGAFIAGLVISESEYSYQAISDILPFKDSFNGLFFISVGMLMDLGFFLSNLTTVMIVVVMIIILKTLTTTLASFLTGSNLRVSLHSGLILSQIGEFSFVLSVAALKSDLITKDMYQIFLSSAIVTMITTPFFIAISSRFSSWATSRRLLTRLQAMRAHRAEIPTKEHKSDHVIIIGFGVNGRNLALVLKELEVPYVILELNGQTVSEFRRKGEPIFYGDATSREILHKAGIERARAAVISITDPSATRYVVKTIRILNRSLYIVVKTAYLAEVDDLIATGADEVIPAEFETSIEVFSRILQFYHMPSTLIRQYAEKFRKDHYKMFVKGETPKRLFHDTIAVMPNVDYESYIVEKGSPAVDASIKDLNIQSRTGALVIAVKRGGKTMQGLLANTVFQAGDIVFLIGEKDSLGKAREIFKA